MFHIFSSLTLDFSGISDADQALNGDRRRTYVIPDDKVQSLKAGNALNEAGGTLESLSELKTVAEASCVPRKGEDVEVDGTKLF